MTRDMGTVDPEGKGIQGVLVHLRSIPANILGLGPAPEAKTGPGPSDTTQYLDTITAAPPPDTLDTESEQSLHHLLEDTEANLKILHYTGEGRVPVRGLREELSLHLVCILRTRILEPAPLHLDEVGVNMMWIDNQDITVDELKVS